MTRRVVRTKTERTLALVARRKAWSGSLTAASLVTPPIRGDPVGENGYSPRLPLAMRLRCKGRGDMMTTRRGARNWWERPQGSGSVYRRSCPS